MMFKQKVSLLVLAIITAILFAGCTKSADTIVHDSKSMLDVVAKAQQTMSKQNGYTADAHSNYHFDMSNLGVLTEETDLSISSSDQPKAFHTVGTSKTAGSDVKMMETYYVDGVIYQKVGSHWSKVSSGLLNSFVAQNQQLGDSLKQFESLVKAYQGGDKTDEVTMIQTKSGDYQMKIDIKTSKGSQVLKKKVLEILQTSMKAETLTSLMQHLMKNIQINAYKATILIEDKTFVLKKISIDSNLRMNVKGMNMSMKQNHIYTFKGPFTGKIEVPADVKANATEVFTREKNS